ncbi:MAG: GDP-mannose 4,6-dehydratase [Actinomycetota bacterium]|nr:GDP-mannose 4,6-dehydratase [Actinomycetota bacterium]
MRVLITGVSGFVGRHLVTQCRRSDAEAEVVGVGRGRVDDALTEDLAEYATVDLNDAEAIAAVIRRSKPDRVFHLAAQASVRASWKAPRETLSTNLTTSINLLEAVRSGAPDARVLVTCSGEEYGPVAGDRLPVTEAEPLRPQNPYAVSKASVDLLAGFYAEAHGLRVVRARAFNHCGPGQKDAYVVAAFAKQIAAAEAEGRARVRVTTGDLRPRRDFTDVRDVVRAYWLAAELAPPGVYNVCAGESTPIADILSGLARHSRIEVDQHTDPDRIRKHEVMEVRGSHEKLTNATGWEPEIPLEETLRDTLDWWRARVAMAASR